eukprot:gene7551-10290_t
MCSYWPMPPSNKKSKAAKLRLIEKSKNSNIKLFDGLDDDAEQQQNLVLDDFSNDDNEEEEGVEFVQVDEDRWEILSDLQEEDCIVNVGYDSDGNSVYDDDNSDYDEDENAIDQRISMASEEARWNEVGQNFGSRAFGNGGTKSQITKVFLEINSSSIDPKLDELIDQILEDNDIVNQSVYINNNNRPLILIDNNSNKKSKYNKMLSNINDLYATPNLIKAIKALEENEAKVVRNTYKNKINSIEDKWYYLQAISILRYLQLISSKNGSKMESSTAVASIIFGLNAGLMPGIPGINNTFSVLAGFLTVGAIAYAYHYKSKKNNVGHKKLKLYYFDMPGRGESIRLACAYSGIELDDVRLNDTQFAELKQQEKLPFGQLPVLEIDNEVIIAQSAAILRYIGKIDGSLYPTDYIQAAIADSIVDAEKDLIAGLTVSRFKDCMGFESVDDSLNAKIRKSLNDDVLPRHLLELELIAKKSKSGWIAGGEKPSIGDFILVPRLRMISSGVIEGISVDILAPFPYLKNLIQKFFSEPSIAHYYSKRK